MTDLPTEN